MAIGSIFRALIAQIKQQPATRPARELSRQEILLGKIADQLEKTANALQGDAQVYLATAELSADNTSQLTNDASTAKALALNSTAPLRALEPSVVKLEKAKRALEPLPAKIKEASENVKNLQDKLQAACSRAQRACRLAEQILAGQLLVRQSGSSAGKDREIN